MTKLPSARSQPANCPRSGTPQKQAKRVKAIRMWSRTNKGRPVGYAYPERSQCAEFSEDDKRPIVPVGVISLEDTDALVEQVARSMTDDFNNSMTVEGTARNVLASLNLLPKKRGK